jgi:hypothetical protein
MSMKWGGACSTGGRDDTFIQIIVWNVKGKKGEVIGLFKSILSSKNGVWIHLAQDKGPVAGCCERGNEFLSSIKIRVIS